MDASGRYHLKRDLMKFPKIRPELESVNPPALFSSQHQTIFKRLEHHSQRYFPQLSLSLFQSFHRFFA